MGEAKNIYFTCLKLKRKLFVGVDKLRNLLGFKKKTLSKNGGRGDDASTGGGVAAWHRHIQSRASDHAGSLRQCAGAGSHLRPRSQPDRAETLPIQPGRLDGEENPLRRILNYATLLETCQFETFWATLERDQEFIDAFGINSFGDEMRKYVCHVVNIT